MTRSFDLNVIVDRLSEHVVSNSKKLEPWIFTPKNKTARACIELEKKKVE